MESRVASKASRISKRMIRRDSNINYSWDRPIIIWDMCRPSSDPTFRWKYRILSICFYLISKLSKSILIFSFTLLFLLSFSSETFLMILSLKFTGPMNCSYSITKSSRLIATNYILNFCHFRTWEFLSFTFFFLFFLTLSFFISLLDLIKLFKSSIFIFFLFPFPF